MTDVVHVLALAHVRTMVSAADPNYVILWLAARRTMTIS